METFLYLCYVSYFHQGEEETTKDRILRLITF